MSEQAPVFDFFSQCARLIDNVCELQKSVAEDLFNRLESEDAQEGAVDTATECCRNIFNGIANNPAKVAEQQINFWQSQLQLCSNFILKLAGEKIDPVIRPKVGDRR